MNNKKVVSHKQRLDNLFNRAKELSSDPEGLSHWARYLCVLVSGFIEASVRTLVLDYSSKKASPDIARFVGEKIKWFQNPKMEKIYELIGEFDVNNKEVFEKGTEGELKEAIDSIVNNRHSIAHGENVGISYVTIRKYYELAKLVIEKLEIVFQS